MVKSRLRDSTLTWWKYVQDERVDMGKTPIANWNALVTKVKEKFLPKDFEIQLHKRRQELKQKYLDVTSYTEEFQRLCLRSLKKKPIKLARYIGGLKWNIQEELSLWAPTSVQRCH